MVIFYVGFIGYLAARSAAKAHIQRASFALPLVLVTPVVFVALVGTYYTGPKPLIFCWDCNNSLALGALILADF